MLEKLPAAVGHLLHNQRAGLEKIAYNLIDLRSGQAQIEVNSLAFIDHGPIPSLYTADGEGISPPLQWSGVPSNASSVLVMVEDADSPTPSPLVHAIVVNLAPQDTAMAEGALASPSHEGAGLEAGRNSYLQAKWLPPDPPPGHGIHRYAFQVYALVGSIDDKPTFSGTPGRDEVLEAIKDRAIASGCLIGTYQREDPTVKIDEADAAQVLAGQSAGQPPLAI
jgi:Raf kinase inhibitor-like YbhB/YbcL family protein